MRNIAISLAVAALVAPLSSFAAAPVKPKAAAGAKPAVAKPAAKKPAAKKPAGPTAAQLKAKAIETSVAAKFIAAKYRTCADFRDQPETWVPATSVAYEVGKGLKMTLASRDFTKGEYETSQEYAARAGKIADLFVGDSRRMPFIIPIEDDAQSFDADAGILKVTIPTGSPKGYVAGNFSDKHIMAFENEKKVGSEMGQTRMGIKFRYDVWVRYEMLLGIDEKLFSHVFANGGSGYYSTLPVELSVSRDEALSLRKNLQLVILGGLVEPFAGEGEDEKVASLDDEYSQYTKTEVWSIEPRCAYLYDGGAKKVLHTYYEEPGVLGPSVEELAAAPAQ